MGTLNCDYSKIDFTFKDAHAQIEGSYKKLASYSNSIIRLENDGKKIPMNLKDGSIYRTLEFIEICMFTITKYLEMNSYEVRERKNRVLVDLFQRDVGKKEYAEDYNNITLVCTYLSVINLKRNKLLHGVELPARERTQLYEDLIYHTSQLSKLQSLCNLLLRSYKRAFNIIEEDKNENTKALKVFTEK